MLSDVRRCTQGSYLDLSGLFPADTFAFLTLKGFKSTDAGTLSGFLAERGLTVSAVHRVEQIHSGTVVDAAEAPCGADALVGRARGEAVRVVTADCVPILLADAETGAYAAVHAGWKGTLARIVQSAAGRLGGARPSSLIAYVGPAVGPCCYTVDTGRYALFEDEFPGWLPPAGDRPALGLQALNARMLEAWGVPRGSIHVEERCTACSVGLCCSYRRDGDGAGRMAALIGMPA